MMDVGQQITFHTKVNIDPLGSYCSLCGRKTAARFWFPIDWNDSITSEQNTEQFKGWFPVGNECAKKFAQGIIIERN